MISILAHKLTPEQVAELGSEPTHIRDIDPVLAGQIANCPGDAVALGVMASDLCRRAADDDDGRILAGSGSPAFTARLGIRAQRFNVTLVFAHSERVSIDEPQPDGSVKKTAIFKHVKFFEV